MSERHVYITPGISREAFNTAAYKATSEDEDLIYYLHEHRHDPYGYLECNQDCTIIEMGKLRRVVDITHTDDANATATG